MNNRNSQTEQFIAELGLTPTRIRLNSLALTSDDGAPALQYGQYILNSDGTPAQTDDGYLMTTTETRTLTIEEANQAQELGIPRRGE